MEAVKKQLPAGLEIEDIYPATPLQLHQVNYLENAIVEDPPVFLFQRSGQPMNMDLDMDLLNQALQIVARRNTNLRTFLLWKGLEKPIQAVCKEVEFEFVSYDFSELDLDLEGKMAKYYRLLEDDWQKTFDRSTNSPMRVAMIKLAEKLFIHFFAGDYMRVDGWSGNNVIDETFNVYGALAAGAPLPEKPANCYKEYMFTLVNQDRETAGKYWRSIFKDFTPQQPLTAMPGNKQGRGSGYARDHVYLGAEISAQLEKLLLEKGWSMSTLVQGIWALLLARYSGKDKVLYGMMTTGRSIATAGIEYMNGHSINILPVIIEVKPGLSLDAYIRQVWDFQTEWTRFEYTEIDDIYDWLGITRKPLFDNFMVIQNLTSAKGEIRGMDRSDAVRHRASHQMYAKMEYPLRFDIFPGVEYCLILEYYRRLFTDAPVKGLLANLYDVLISVIQNPEQRVEDLKNSIDPERYKEFADAEPNEFFK